MPSHSKETRQRIAFAKKWGWRKGCYGDVLIARINAFMNSSAEPVTVREIHTALVATGDYPSDDYSWFDWHLNRARRAGLIENEDGIRNGTRGISKFHVGDKVRIKPYRYITSKWLCSQLRLDTPRTIVAAVETGEHTDYFLGWNKQGVDALQSRKFKACELIPYAKNERVGRPRLKRSYRRREASASVVLPVTEIEATEPHATVSPSISCVNCEKVSVTE